MLEIEKNFKDNLILELSKDFSSLVIGCGDDNLKTLFINYINDCKLRIKTNQTFKNDLKYLENAKFRRDVRSAIKYLKDLYKGWVVEDVIFDVLVQSLPQDFDVTRTGCDSLRKVKENLITTKPDIRITKNNDPWGVLLEVKASYLLFNKVNIKPSESQLNPGYICLMYFVPEGKFFLCNPKKENKKLLPNESWGGKLTYCYTKEEYFSRLMDVNYVIDVITNNFSK